MTDCPVYYDTDRWICPDCSWTTTLDGPETRPGHNCPNAPDLQEARERLGITFDDMKHYAQALVRWRAAGYPTRSKEEVERIYNENCEPCEHRVEGRCGKCRCRVNKSGMALTNMLAMATEGCKDNRFPPGNAPMKASPGLIAVYEARS